MAEARLTRASLRSRRSPKGRLPHPGSVISGRSVARSYRSAVRTRQGRYEETAQLQRSTIDQAPGYTSPYLALAVSLIELGQPEEAREVLERVMALNPRLTPERVELFLTALGGASRPVQHERSVRSGRLEGTDPARSVEPAIEIDGPELPCELDSSHYVDSWCCGCGRCRQSATRPGLPGRGWRHQQLEPPANADRGRTAVGSGR